MRNWYLIAAAMVVLVAGGFGIKAFLESRQPLINYDLSKTSPAPFKRLTIKGKVQGGVTRINGSKVPQNAHTLKEPISYTWESEDGRFRLTDNNIFKDGDELFEYNIEVAEHGEVIPGTTKAADSVVTVTNAGSIGLGVRVELFVPDILNVEVNYDVYELNGFKLYGLGGYNTQTGLLLGLGVLYEF